MAKKYNGNEISEGVKIKDAESNNAETNNAKTNNVQSKDAKANNAETNSIESNNYSLHDCPHCSDRKKKRTEEEKKALLMRLKKAEGQIRGIQNMIEKDAYCPDILIQVSAVTAALNSFNKELLSCHIRSCVSEDIKAGNDEAIDEFVNVLKKLMK